jgi:hypothetical protein
MSLVQDAVEVGPSSPAEARIELPLGDILHRRNRAEHELDDDERQDERPDGKAERRQELPDWGRPPGGSVAYGSAGDHALITSLTYEPARTRRALSTIVAASATEAKVGSGRADRDGRFRAAARGANGVDMPPELE